ncbi:ABC transporter permease [Fructilactobacillus sp. Tb1]|uniref:ABC transporter permease n=1 Tax=Fructilactobacillus sp. Tb1 TaxID=3422304 RepID=UPI003D291A1B
MRVWTIIKRICLEMIRDKRTLLMMFIAPLFILTLVNFLFTNNTEPVTKLGVQNVNTKIVNSIKNSHLKVHDVADNKDPRDVIEEKNYAGVLTQKGNHLELTLQNSDQSKTGLLLQGIKAAQVKLHTQAAKETITKQALALDQMQKQLSEVTHVNLPTHQQPQPNQYSFSTKYLYGSSKSTFFDTLLPIMIVFIIFFFVFLISGVSFLGERTSGTLERVLATPVRKSQIVMGYIGGYGSFAAVQSLLITLFSIYVFKVQILGSIWNVIIISLFTALVALTLGLLISTFANSAFQMVQFIPLVMLPQVFFSGIVPIQQMADWLQPISRIMPLYYSAQAISDVIQKGNGILQILPNLLILLVFALVFYGLNIIVMKKYRRV